MVVVEQVHEKSFITPQRAGTWFSADRRFLAIHAAVNGAHIAATEGIETVAGAVSGAPEAAGAPGADDCVGTHCAPCRWCVHGVKLARAARRPEPDRARSHTACLPPTTRSTDAHRRRDCRNAPGKRASAWSRPTRLSLVPCERYVAVAGDARLSTEAVALCSRDSVDQVRLKFPHG
jgi:hypothetical protein